MKNLLKNCAFRGVYHVHQKYQKFWPQFLIDQFLIRNNVYQMESMLLVSSVRIFYTRSAPSSFILYHAMEGMIFPNETYHKSEPFLFSPRGSTLPKLCTRFPKSWGFWKPHKGFLGFLWILKVSGGFPGTLGDSQDSLGFQGILGDSRGFLWFLRDSRGFQGIPGVSKGF